MKDKIRRVALVFWYWLLFVPYFLLMTAGALMDITARIILSTGDYWGQYLQRLERKAKTPLP